ncbi:unnamed protein product [Haemonchus placei]|uniref:Uncharacterized protein n=1 Tax=Haemonchus placei TaxID=6290 RepID=A0A0N4VW91_HAEPC|nr:unnamed protein product [Haemonchus placei]
MSLKDDKKGKDENGPRKSAEKVIANKKSLEEKKSTEPSKEKSKEEQIKSKIKKTDADSRGSRRIRLSREAKTQWYVVVGDCALTRRGRWIFGCGASWNGAYSRKITLRRTGICVEIRGNLALPMVSSSVVWAKYLSASLQLYYCCHQAKVV